MKSCAFLLLSGLILLSSVSLLEAGQPLPGPNEYVIDLPDQQLHFVRKPQLGYVVVSREQPTAIQSLEGILKEFQAQDVRPVGGRGRRGLAVVHSRRLSGENDNIIARLRTHSQIKYVAPLFSSNEQTVAIIPEIVARVAPGVDAGRVESFCRAMNLTVKRKLAFTEREYLIEVPAADADGVFQAVEQLKKADFVEWAVPNVAFRPRLFGQVIPNDEYFPNQWHLNNTGQSGGTPGADINAPKAWGITTGNPNIVVAVLDEGVDTDHPDLIDNIVAGYDFFEDDNDPNPTGDDAHGTACAGLIAAKGNNGIGVTGVAWNCKIMPVRIAGGYEYITEEDVATAIRWAANNGADVLSNSWGGDFEMPTIHSAIQDVTEQGGIGRGGRAVWFCSPPAIGNSAVLLCTPPPTMRLSPSAQPTTTTLCGITAEAALNWTLLHRAEIAACLAISGQRT